MADPTESRRTRRIIHATLGAIVVAGFAIADWRSAGPGLLKALVHGTATLVVHAPVDGAEVVIDGVPIGVTPFARDDLLAGRRGLQVRHPWYRPYVADVELQRGERTERSIEFPPAEGALLLATNPQGAQVWLDGTPLEARTPLTLDPIAAGAHDVELRMFGRATVRRTIGVPPGEVIELVEQLATVDSGALVVRTTPAHATVRLTDAPIAYAPDVHLPVGDYALEVSAPGYESRVITHRLRKGVNELDVTLTRREGTLTVNVAPADANVTLVRDGRTVEYRPGVRLPTGPVEVQVRKAGHRTVVRRVNIGNGPQSLDLRLERIDAKEGEWLRDALGDLADRAPAVVVVTGGTDNPFAIGVHEVTVADFARYAQAMDVEAPSLKDSGADHPVAKVSWDEAVAYTKWLSDVTGHVYRLPSDREWTLVERRGGAAGGSPCERGNVGDASLRRVYREFDALECDDGYVRTAPVGSFPANALGVRDLFGNVAEWVSDCGYGGCNTHFVRGSAWDSSGSELDPGYRASYDRPGDTRGFRIVREL